MVRIRAFVAICALLGSALIGLGALCLFTFLRYQAPGQTGVLGLGPTGHYLIAFLGCALVGWGGSLLAALRRPMLARGVATATATALVLSALYRMVAWIVGDYAALGDVLRVEVAIFLLLALALVWLRPPKRALGGP
jgi:hypothetical protein